MTFDLAQMIADREAGTPGLWFVAGVRVKMDEQQWIAISRYDEASKRDENICCAGYDPKTGLGSTDARRIARVPLLEAEIIRLTARVAELEALTDDIIRAGNGLAQMLLGDVAMTKPALEAFVTRHINARNAWDAALSTHTDEPKT